MRRRASRRSVLRALVAAGLGRPLSTARSDDRPAQAGPDLVLLTAGTRVGDDPPLGWSDLVIKSIPRLESGDLESLPTVASSTATLFRTVILADVRKAGADGPFTLRRVGLGLCTPVDKVDTVVDRSNASSEPIDFGLVAREVLDRADGELKKARLIARTGTFAVLASPSELCVGGAHRKVYLVYAFALAPKSGRLQTWLWSVDADAKKRTPPEAVTLLPPGLSTPCGLDVEAERLLGALPVGWSFAMRRLPEGRRVAVPDGLKPWTVDLKAIAARPAEFEARFRRTLARDD